MRERELDILAVADLHYASSPERRSPMECRVGWIAPYMIRKALLRLRHQGVDVDVVVLLGDILESPDMDDLRRIAECLTVPVIAVPGNHDNAPRMYEDVFGTRPGPNRVGSYTFLVFHDDIAAEDVTTRSGETLKLMHDTSGEDTLCVAVQHNPVYPHIDKKYPYMISNAQAVRAAYADAGIVLSLSGHYHPGQSASIDRGVTYHTVAAGCESPFRFSHIALRGRDVQTTEHELRMATPGLWDCHSHTQLAYCATTAEVPLTTDLSHQLGLGGICITEHAFQLYFERRAAWSWRWQTDMAMLEAARGGAENRMDQFRRMAAQLRSHATKIGFAVRIGLEVDLRADGSLLLAEEDLEGWEIAAQEMEPTMDRNFFEGVFAGEANIPAVPVDETITMVDGPLPADRTPSFWTLYEKDWYKYVSEKDVFNALLRHSDRDGKKDWEIGIGAGGQLYSWRGPWGEAIPPQAAPWMDEVWQATVHCPHVQKVLNAVYAYDDEQSNGTNSVGQAFVHGSGCSNKYGARGDEPYTMFFCPKLASWYDAEDKSYAMINWGQSSTQPTIFPHKILYYSRYRYLGDGVLEVSNIVYNFGDYDYGYNGTPWGGVRATTFPEVFWSNADGSWHFNNKLIRFGRDQGVYRPPAETDGWLGAAATKDDLKSPAFGFAFGRSVGSCCVGSAGHGPPRDYIVMASNPAGFSPATTLSKGESFWVRYYLVVGAFEDVVRNARKYAEKAGWGDLNLPETRATTQALYRVTLDDGTIGLTRRANEGAEAACRVYNEPVLHARPLFVIRELPVGRRRVTTAPYALSRKEPYPNPLPEDHEFYTELKGAVKRYTYESEARKQLRWELLGFVMPRGKTGRNQSSYVELSTIVDTPGTRGMLALAVSESGGPVDGDQEKAIRGQGQ